MNEIKREQVKKTTKLGHQQFFFLQGRATQPYINVLLSLSKAFQSFPASLNFKHDLQRCFPHPHVREEKPLPVDFTSSAGWKERLFAGWGSSCPEEDLKAKLDPADSDLALKIWLERWKGSQIFRCLLHRGENHPTQHTGLQSALGGNRQSRRAYSASGHLGIWRAEERQREK